MWEGKPQKDAQWLISRAVINPLNRGIHGLVVIVIVVPVLVQAQLPFKVGIIIFAAGLPAQPGINRPGTLCFLAAIVYFAGVAFGPAGNLPGGQVVAVVHPDIVARVFQLLKKGGLTRMQKVPHGTVAVHMRIQAGEKAAAAGNAHGVLAISVGEGNRLSAGKCIQAGGDGGRVSHVAHGIPTHFVRVENDDVRAFCHDLFPLSLTVPAHGFCAGLRHSRRGRSPPNVCSNQPGTRGNGTARLPQ